MPKVAIITGNTSGLGFSLSTQLLKAGWSIVGVSRGSDGSAGEQHENNPGFFQVTGSVSEQTTVEAAFEAAASLGNANLVVNCAGQGCFGEVGSYNADDISVAIAGNLAGLILFSDYGIRHMAENGGDIVNVMSTAAKKYRAAESVYTAMKWGAKAYTRTIRDAIKAKKMPIRVFEVYPCGMSTNFWSSAIRPATDGATFPSPEPIARSIIDVVTSQSDSYQQELTFERS